MGDTKYTSRPHRTHSSKSFWKTTPNSEKVYNTYLANITNIYGKHFNSTYCMCNIGRLFFNWKKYLLDCKPRLAYFIWFSTTCPVHPKPWMYKFPIFQEKWYMIEYCAIKVHKHFYHFLLVRCLQNPLTNLRGNKNNNLWHKMENNETWRENNVSEWQQRYFKWNSSVGITKKQNNQIKYNLLVFYCFSTSYFKTTSQWPSVTNNNNYFFKAITDLTYKLFLEFFIHSTLKLPS